MEEWNRSDAGSFGLSLCWFTQWIVVPISGEMQWTI